MSSRLLSKRGAQAVCLVLAFPAALICGFGRFGILFTLLSHYFALMPGFVGDFLRAAFYRLTLEDCSPDVVIAFGTFFSRTQVTVGPNVSIGSYCIIGQAKIGARTQISSHVEIPGGRTQHTRDAQGRLSSALEDFGGFVTIGEDCWIGASCVIMADVGSQTTIGAGSVVVKNIPAGVVAVGSPAKAIKSSV
jgi:acetyltransferase-like isoleucine patch superfamily enzyme